MYGLSGESEVQVAYERKNADKIIRYRVMVDLIDVASLQSEKEALLADLAEIEPNDNELKEAGKAFFPFYTRDEVAIQRRIDVIDSILGIL